MTGPADPLAVMDAAKTFATAYNLPNTAADFAQARADVAALIEAAREVAQADRDGALTDVLIDRLDAALAPFAGDKT